MLITCPGTAYSCSASTKLLNVEMPGVFPHKIKTPGQSGVFLKAPARFGGGRGSYVDNLGTRRRASCRASPGYGPWELSADRANAIRKILEEEGVPAASFFMVAGRADTQPLFPDDPFVAANRRVTITLMREAPPMSGQS